MATETRVAVDEYLSTIYEPDAEFLDGTIEERNVGEWEHNQVQYYLVNWFKRHGGAWQIRAVQEQRTKLQTTRYRIPDVSVFPRAYPIEQIFTRPQLIAIEVLSPEDRRPAIHARLVDFLDFGVQHAWVIDPQTRQGWDCSTGEWLPRERFEVPGTPIYLSLPELFAELDADEA
jgi:Uma2 family endonuclease